MVGSGGNAHPQDVGDIADAKFLARSKGVKKFQAGLVAERTEDHPYVFESVILRQRGAEPRGPP